MTSTEPQVLLTGQYTIKETCKALGISRETLRKYTEQGHINVKHRISNLRPFYVGKDIIRFWKASII